MQKLLLSLILLVATAAASAADSPKDVQALIARGDYPGAEAALREAITDHPQSAKAHYVLAEVLAHEGNIGEAKTEANKAAALDPATHFTDPAKFQAFQQKLNEALAPVSANRSPAASPVRYADTRPAGGREGGGFGLGSLVVVGLVIAVIAFLWSRRRRAPDASFPGYGPVPPPAPGGPYSGAPGGYPGYAPPPSSGVGSTIAAGVGGLAAGMLLDEALRSHGGNDTSRESGLFGGNGGTVQNDPSADAYNDLRSDPIDMGNDDTSWDNGSSSDDGGSFDDNQW
jgi:hypothetical protein